MQNPFNHENYPSNELKRNTFPCSFQNNLTMKYGYIYPAGIWRTVPGATYKIRPTLGLNFMPTTFPVQTRQKVYVHYFYGRDRNFWKDYKDFVNGQRPDLVKPYIDESVTQARTGKLLDYLGVPTTIVGKYGQALTKTVQPDYYGMKFIPVNESHFQAVLNSGQQISNDNLTAPDFIGLSLNDVFEELSNKDTSNPVNAYLIQTFPISDGFENAFELTLYANEYDNHITPTFDQFFGNVSTNPLIRNGVSYARKYATSDVEISFANYYRLALVNKDNNIVLVSSSVTNNNGILRFHFDFPDNFNKKDVIKAAFLAPFVLDAYYETVDNSAPIVKLGLQITQSFTTDSPYSLWYHGYSLSYSESADEVVDITDETSPYWRTGATTDLRERIKLNAYLPRFYETVYNLYYRNPQNNPYILEGRPEYNKFIPSKDGGVDSNLYELRRRNWEDDFLTTAVQSPQQGIAPLVGLTDRGATLTLTNEDGTVTRYNVTTTDNGSITGIEANDTSAEPVLTKALIDAVSYGISIEDIRNVNAMQKWLELNLRKGYQYKDIIQSRWGISISYNELDLPEFIGGFTKDVELQAVTQTANVSDDVTGQLGWQAGRLYASGEGREITHYCDEEGFIMCLITVVPVPNYSQLLPKHWFERDLLDSYQPEFNHIGFQPITYKEVCPVQAYQESSENVNVLEQTFGYQRPWYQYFNYTDEVHGQFRTTFKDFLINRVFDVKPELSESFLLVDPEQINDVFNVPDADDDKIIGAIYHNCVAKLPISLYAQARLE